METDHNETYTVELTREELLRTRIALINMAKEWDDMGDSGTAQDFRDTLKPYAFNNDCD